MPLVQSQENGKINFGQKKKNIGLTEFSHSFFISIFCTIYIDFGYFCNMTLVQSRENGKINFGLKKKLEWQIFLIPLCLYFVRLILILAIFAKCHLFNLPEGELDNMHATNK